MKINRKLNVVYTLLLSAVATIGLVACNGGENNEEEEIIEGTGTQYIFEAEYVELTDDMVGTGTSGNPYGQNLIQYNTEASNNYFIHSLSERTPLRFQIHSSATITTTLYGRFGNNALGTNEWNTENFSITVNDVSINFNSFTTRSSTSNASSQNFTTYDLGEITLNEGDNVITLVPLTNTIYGGYTAGPSVDYITMITTATLTMTQYNLDFLS